MTSPTTADLPALPALVHGHVSHQRRSPVQHGFRHRLYQWLVDLDDMPQPPWFLRAVASFHARDHLGGSGDNTVADIKTNLLRYLSHQGVHLSDDCTVIMLANARVLGHVFDPLSVFWCFDPGGALRCIVAEVHNTYRQRHAYLLHPDGNGAAHAEKAFYVSPFNDVSGAYTLRFHLSDSRVTVAISLQRDGDVAFEALFSGVPTPATPTRVARAALRTPAMPHRVSALIRLHGIWLWLRRLPVVSRPSHQPPKGLR